jgi:hypothetical protein
MRSPGAALRFAVLRFVDLCDLQLIPPIGLECFRKKLAPDHEASFP